MNILNEYAFLFVYIPKGCSRKGFRNMCSFIRVNFTNMHVSGELGEEGVTLGIGSPH